mmetsp:Transcript_8616/g.12856  ORF Transcript_8616/g.12856 Transcript_8616/m.12856 type:complete len:468 (-) Transcript_8616:84-1487(-)|eukprot:CAMPEP_0185027036 /NCGR_PEP_ID=MMETSP1103-20130426/11862_1 /TAXON_ID=36769 /ORGANISM="Paraphysomonas bandaiensis, Strain Caron Lab Isolate" /LENGTH=467 /DNA_ID=CAMNT_0027560879 /DNA_START=25 /DNA_END=1428 /DNA_ORIENTATION=-
MDIEGESAGAVASDVVCVYGSMHRTVSTEFHVKITRSLSSSLYRTKLTEEDLLVAIYCNGALCRDVMGALDVSSRLIQFIESDGSRSTCPSSHILCSLGLLRGRNSLVFHSKVLNIKAECSVYLWSVTDKIVVVDIDGTLTKSDVRGYVETVYLGRYDYVHEGAVSFFSLLHKEFSVCTLYLTSRPLHHLADTRAFLRLVQDHKGHHLPPGPLFTNRENVMRAIYRELVAKTTAQFKGSVLIDVLSVFVSLGSPSTPYCLGVGNKETDALAYRMAGLNAARILLVQPSSEIRVSVALPGVREGTGGTAEVSFNTYSDPALVEYVRHKMQWNDTGERAIGIGESRPPELPGMPDGGKEDGEDRIFPWRHREEDQCAEENVTGEILHSSIPPPPPTLSANSSASSAGSPTQKKKKSRQPVARATAPTPPPPPVDFTGGHRRNLSKAASVSGKKLSKMTDFFNPNQAADI